MQLLGDFWYKYDFLLIEDEVIKRVQGDVLANSRAHAELLLLQDIYPGMEIRKLRVHRVGTIWDWEVYADTAVNGLDDQVDEKHLPF